MITQNKYETAVKNAIKYGLKHREKENLKDEIQTLLNYSIDEDKEITITDDKIEIRVLKTNRVIGINFESDIDYVGYTEKGKIIIDRRWYDGSYKSENNNSDFS